MSKSEQGLAKQMSALAALEHVWAELYALPAGASPHWPNQETVNHLENQQRQRNKILRRVTSK